MKVKLDTDEIMSKKRERERVREQRLLKKKKYSNEEAGDSEKGEEVIATLEDQVEDLEDEALKLLQEKLN